MFRRVAVAAGVPIALFAIVTLAALEGGEVVKLETADAAGNRHTTRAWIAESEGALWLESANAEREFYRDVLAGSRITIERHGTETSFRAIPQENPQGHELIRRLLREKYGWADVWVGFLADTSESIALRLEE